MNLAFLLLFSLLFISLQMKEIYHCSVIVKGWAHTKSHAAEASRFGSARRKSRKRANKVGQKTELKIYCEEVSLMSRSPSEMISEWESKKGLRRRNVHTRNRESDMLMVKSLTTSNDWCLKGYTVKLEFSEPERDVLSLLCSPRLCSFSRARRKENYLNNFSFRNCFGYC